MMSEVVWQFDLYLNHFKQQKDQPLDGARGLLNDRLRVPTKPETMYAV